MRIIIQCVPGISTNLQEEDCQLSKKIKKRLAVTAQNVNSNIKKVLSLICSRRNEKIRMSYCFYYTTHTGRAETTWQGPSVKDGVRGGKAQALLTGLKTETNSAQHSFVTSDGSQATLWSVAQKLYSWIQIQVCSCTWTHAQRRPQWCYLWEQSNRDHPMPIKSRRDE